MTKCDTYTMATFDLSEYERGQMLALQALHRNVPRWMIARVIRQAAQGCWTDRLRGYADTIADIATKETA